MSKKTDTKKTFPIILIQTFLLGCGQEAPELLDTEWDLISLDGKGHILDTAITLNFTNEYLGGEMGCNLYGGREI